MNIKKVGPYIIGKTLGRGSFSKVKSGVHCENGTEVAIKIIQKSKLSEETGLIQKFRKEMTLQRIFSHPNVIKTLQFIETETHLFLVLEKLSKGELFDYIVEKDYLPSDQARKIFRQIIFGLEYIHSFCIAHRDLKPENILLDENLNVKIADFGMAHINEMNTLLKTACGSPHYVAPEILKREKYNGMITDIWSCGVILYALLTGSLPFNEESYTELITMIKKGKINFQNISLKESEKDLIKQMLTVDPKKRITIERIKKHPWFVENIPKGYQFPKVEKKILKNIHKPIAYSNINKSSLQQLESIQETNMESLLIDLRKEGSNETKILYQIINKTKNHLETDNSGQSNNAKKSDKKKTNDKQKKKKRSSSFQRIGKTNTRKKSLKDSSKIQPLKSNFYFEEKTKINQLNILIKKTNRENKITINELFEIALKLDIFDITFNKRNKKDKDQDNNARNSKTNNDKSNTTNNRLEITKKKKKRTNSITSKFKLFTKILNNSTKKNEHLLSKNTSSNNIKSENSSINSEKGSKNDDDTDNSYNSNDDTNNNNNNNNDNDNTNNTTTSNTTDTNNDNNTNSRPSSTENSNTIFKDIQTIFRKLNFNKINFDSKKKVIIEQLMDNSLGQNIFNSNTSELLIQFIQKRLYRFGSTKKKLEKYLLNYQLNSENSLKDKSEFCSLNNKTQKKINQKLKTHLKNIKKKLFKRIENNHNIPTYQFPDRLIGISSSKNTFEVITQLQSALTINDFDWKHKIPGELKIKNRQTNMKMKIKIQTLPFQKIVNKVCNNYLSKVDRNLGNDDNTSNKKLLKKKLKIHSKTTNQILAFNTENEKRKWNVFISIINYSNNKKNISKHAKNIIKFVNH